MSERRFGLSSAGAQITYQGRREYPRDPRNARFWIFHIEGYVKITLAPGDFLHHSRGWNHDEGWTVEFFTLAYDGAVVEMSGGTDGTDCDGRMETAHAYECKLALLKVHEVEGTEIKFPQWDHVSASQRDHTAEAAGY